MSAYRPSVVTDDPTTAPRLAREQVARCLTDAGARPDALFDDALLVTSELVTNAVRHADPHIDLKVVTDHGVFRLEVHDRGRSGLVRRNRSPDLAGGWGLNVVHRLATDWGVVPARPGQGKTVWAELPLTYGVPSASTASSTARPRGERR
jgi:anti-sigma regulatory factor (Ser/Thr protein kinase)